MAGRTARQLVRRSVGRLAGRAADRHVLRRRGVGVGPVHQVRRVAGPDAVRRSPCSPRWPCSCVRRTSWREVESLPLPRKRRAGEIARVAGVLYRRHPGTFAAVGMVAIPMAALALLTGAVVTTTAAHRRSDRGLRHRRHGRTLRHRLDHRRRVRPLRLRRDHRGGRVDRRRPGRRAGCSPAPCGQWPRRAGALGSAFFIAAVVIIVLSLFLVGIPIAIWLFVRWQFTARW